MGIQIEAPGPEASLAPQASQQVRSTATAPAAAQVIGNIVPSSPGVYKIDVYTELSGTVTASEQDNLRLQVDSVTIFTLPLSSVNAAGVVMPVISVFARTVGTNVRVQAVAASGVAAVYGVSIVITKIGP